MIANLTTAPGVGKLLLNAWNAEYCLRIKYGPSNRDYLNKALNWVFPQAYYTVFFSVRAALAVDGINMANEDEIIKLVSQWAASGEGGPAYTRQGNPFDGLLEHRITARHNPDAYRFTAPEAAAIHVQLIERVYSVNTITETYIHNRLGSYSYQHLFSTAPDYLKADFVGVRTRSVIALA